MAVIEMFSKELEQEAQTTRKMLALVPDDKYDWQPHVKSMTMGRLAGHVAELPGWVEMALTTDELDFANNPYEPEKVTNTRDLLAYFEKNLAAGKAQLSLAQPAQLGQPWTLREGGQVYSTSTKGEVIRMALSQIIHHRAQLGVYLRLLDIPIPGSYGPSADETAY
ncbi:MAG: DinB family protein [Adhaeribacter sp.]